MHHGFKLLKEGGTFGLAWIGLAMALAGSPAGETDRPNIVFIYADDHAYQAISAYGSRINATPNIDRLAEEGMRFDECYVSNSICGPMRAVIQTGKYSHKNDFYFNNAEFDGSQPTFPKMLQRVGYQTAILGKWHLGSDPQGYDFWRVLPGQGHYYNPRFRSPKGINQKHGYVTDIITDMTIDWLSEQRDRDKPFMLMYQHKAPHGPWQPAPKHYELYENETIPEPPTLFDKWEGRSIAPKLQDMTLEHTLQPWHVNMTGPPQRLDEAQAKRWRQAFGDLPSSFEALGLEGKALTRWKYQHYIKNYLRVVKSLDENVGRLLDYLERSGLAENTIVIYTSDQGFYLGEHGWYDKRWMYEQSLRTPLLIRWPGVTEPNSKNDDIVSPVDFGPTFLDLAEANVPKAMQGRSLVPLLKGRTPSDWREYFYYHYYENPGWHYVPRHYGVTDGRYKLIHFYNLDEWELYDRQFAPNELKSVYNNPAYSQVQRRLKENLQRLRKELEVPEEDPPGSYRKSGPKRRRPLPEKYQHIEPPTP